MNCVAAPVRDHDGDMLAAISISVPTIRWSRAQASRYAELVRRGAADLSKRLGYVTQGRGSGMKIASLRTGVVGTPWRNLTFVEVRTDDGLTGVGETRMLNHTDALLGYLAEAEGNHVLGSDPFEIESLVQRMYHRDYARAGEIVMLGEPSSSSVAPIPARCY